MFLGYLTSYILASNTKTLIITMQFIFLNDMHLKKISTRSRPGIVVIGISTIFFVIHDTCRVVNVILRHKISWYIGIKLVQTQHDFKRFKIII